jgi:hypothetical protein
MIGKGAISLDRAKNIAVSVGKQLVDRGNLNGGKLSLDIINDVSKASLPKRLRPLITTDVDFLNRVYNKYGVSKEQAQANQTLIALATFKPNIKGHFVYINKTTLEQSNSLGLSGYIAHEIFHCLSRGKTVKGKKELKEMQHLFKKGYRPKAGTERSDVTVNLQLLIRKAFNIDGFLNPTPELGKLYTRLNTKDRCFAKIRTTLRTVMDPRLKQGETRLSRDKINPNSTVVRPTVSAMQRIIDMFKEEANAFKVNGIVDKYSLSTQNQQGMVINGMISNLLRDTVPVLEGEMAILKKNG